MIRGVGGEIRYWSRGAERLYGWSSSEAVGNRSHELLETEFPEHVERINDRLRADGFWRGELLHHHRSGRHVHVASHWVLRRSESDENVVEVNNDITDRIGADESRRLHAAIIADSDDAIVGKTLGGIITSWNQAAEAMFGWPASDIIGKSITMIIPPDKLEEEATIVAKLRAGERIDHFETVRQRRDGQSVIISLTVSPIRGPTGAIIGASKIARDIGRQRQTEAALQRTRRMEALGELTGGVAHDFNNLLSVIIGNIQYLRQMLDDATEASGMADDILTAAMTGGELTRQLLAFARQQSLKLEIVDLNEYLASYVGLLRRTLGRGITIATVFEPKLWLTHADASQIGDALINLALNARDAMPESGGHLTIQTANVHVDTAVATDGRTGHEGDHVMLAVTDNGSGMTPEVLERATEPFYTTKPVGTGNGLGLSSVHGTLAQHGGYLNIASKPGQGTTVRLYLPRVENQRAARPPHSRNSAPMPRGTEAVLVVDDNAQLRTVVVRQLVSLGYHTEEAADGPEALALIEAGSPCDLLFTDLVMPGGLTGFRLAEMVQALRPAAKVLLTTGFARVSDVADGSPLYHMLCKPYHLHQLAGAVRTALENAEPEEHPPE